MWHALKGSHESEFSPYARPAGIQAIGLKE
jgi:hypothetical protein